MRGFGGDCQAGLSRWRRRGWCASRQAADGAVAAIPVRRSAWPRLASGAESPERDRTAGGRIGLQRGLLINAPRTDTLRFMPALTVTRQEIDRMIAILGEVLKEFSIATECGFGRRPAETIPQLLRIHAEIAALP